MSKKSRRGGGPRRPEIDLTRRRLLTGIAAAASGLALDSCGESAAPSLVLPPLPTPASSGVENIIVVMMENRSYDHMLGWLPGGDGKQKGLTYLDRDGFAHPTYPLAPEFQGCAFQDPDHSHEGGMTQYNAGLCDGFLLTSPNDIFPIGYYTQADLSFTGQAAPAWTVYDRYFTSIMAETYPNRFYQHSAQTYQIHNNIQDAFTNPATIPTIWDNLSAAGVTGAYYYNDAPFIGLWGRKYIDNGTAQPFSKFLTDCQNGTLPNVSFVDPFFEDEGSGTSKDDHPFADIRDGQAFLNQIYDAVRLAPQWPNIVMFINYDEWGGFFDHVPPPDSGVIPEADRAACEREGVEPFSLMGFRVPTMCISPFARRGYVDHLPYDHCSILKMIEWRWGLPYLTERDKRAVNIAYSLDLGNANLPTTAFTVPAGPFGTACNTQRSGPGEPTPAEKAREKHFKDIRTLKAVARHYGYPVK